MLDRREVLRRVVGSTLFGALSPGDLAGFSVIASPADEETGVAPVEVHVAKFEGTACGQSVNVVVEDPWGVAHAVVMRDRFDDCPGDRLSNYPRERFVRLGTVDTFYALDAETVWTADPATRKVRICEGRGLYLAAFEVEGPRAEWDVVLPGKSICGVVEFEGLKP